MIDFYLLDVNIRQKLRIFQSSTTLLTCGSANGILLPPYIIFKEAHVYNQWTDNGPKGKPYCEENCCELGSCYNHAKSGWIDSISFIDWFQRVLLPRAKRVERT